jgi:hypothetical protein
VDVDELSAFADEGETEDSDQDSPTILIENAVESQLEDAPTIDSAFIVCRKCRKANHATADEDGVLPTSCFCSRCETKLFFAMRRKKKSVPTSLDDKKGFRQRWREKPEFDPLLKKAPPVGSALS